MRKIPLRVENFNSEVIMKIEVLIDDLPQGQKLSRITVDFDNGVPKTSIHSTSGGKVAKSTKQEDSTAIDFSTLGDIKVSQEIVEKPEVPDVKDRKISISQNMQNLKI